MDNFSMQNSQIIIISYILNKFESIKIINQDYLLDFSQATDLQI